MKSHIFAYFLLFTFCMISCKSPAPRKPVVSKSSTFINESIERNKKIYEKEKVFIENMITKDTVNTYLASESGFWYYYTKKDSVDKPTPLFGNKVSFTYDVTDLNGKAIYSKKDLGLQKYTIDQEELFSGLREGLKLMKTGEEITFIFPSQMAYGFIGDNNRIGINVPIVCNVTLKSIDQ